MKRIGKTRTRGGRGFALALWVLGGASCTLGPIEVSPNPPDFRPLPRAQIRTAMGALAVEIQQLEALLESADRRSVEGQRAMVLETLDRMRTAAERLDRPGRTNQHPGFDLQLGRFTQRLERARREVERDPPRYFLAGTVAGACSLCHRTQTARAPFPSAPDAFAARRSPR